MVDSSFLAALGRHGRYYMGTAIEYKIKNSRLTLTGKQMDSQSLKGASGHEDSNLRGDTLRSD
jgi:hypothetical protein